MKLILKLAWRNIWRNKRRTQITLLSMIVAVILSVGMRSMQLGAYELMIENVVSAYTGHLQIQHPKFNDDKIIDNSLAADTAFIDKVKSVKGVRQVFPRLESFALAAGKENTRGVLVVGINPDAEQQFNQLSDKVTAGEYLDSDDNGALVAEGLADFLGCTVGDSLVIMGQGYHGTSAAALLPIRGVMRFASPELNKRFVYSTVAQAQELFSTGNRLTSLVVEPENSHAMKKMVERLHTILNNDAYAVLTWRELIPELVQQISGDNAGGLIMLGILYMVVAFGIFGTVLMMTNERMREFGVVNALGLSVKKLATMAGVEIVLIALIAGVLGTLFSLPIVLWYHYHPIRFTGEAAKSMINFGIEPVWPFLLDWRLFASQALLVLCISCATALFPLFVLRKLNPVEAMRK